MARWIGLLCLNGAVIDDESGVPMVDAAEIIGDAEEPGDRSPYGQIPLLQCLGVSSMPFPPDEDGISYAEGVCVENVAGYPAACVGARDHRSARIYGNLKPGDTALHATGPDASAQVLCKADRKTVVATKGSDGKQILFMLDGKNDAVTLLAFGHAFQVTERGGIEMSSANGVNGITVSDDYVHIKGTILVGGMAPTPGLTLGIATAATWAVAGATPAPGVFVGL